MGEKSLRNLRKNRASGHHCRLTHPVSEEDSHQNSQSAWTSLETQTSWTGAAGIPGRAREAQWSC